MRYIIILFLISTLFADNHKPHKEHHLHKELSHLELSKKQKIDVKKILREFRLELKEYKELEEDIEEKRKDIFSADTLDTDKLDTLNKILDDKAHGIEKDFLIKMHTLLTPLQRKKFADYFDDWKVD